MTSLSEFKGFQRAGGHLHLGWIISFLILLGSGYFVKEYQSRQNEVFQKQMREMSEKIDALRARINTGESDRAKFEAKLSLESETRETKIQRLEKQVSTLEASLKPVKKTKKK